VKKIVVAIAILAAMLAVDSAVAKESKIKWYGEGTVVRVGGREREANVSGQNPNDAPLADPETFAYDVVVHVNCGSYVGRYQSWYDYLPSVLAPNQKIHFRMTRSVMYVDVPNQKELELSIISKHVERGSCEMARQ
jgi:opacity protein-like surface antigen